MLMPSPLLATTKKVKCRAVDLPHLLQQLRHRLALPANVALAVSLPAEGGAAPVVPLTSLDDIHGGKAKLQVWARNLGSHPCPPTHHLSIGVLEPPVALPCMEGACDFRSGHARTCR
jgi:hypothetical protein